MYPAEAAIIWGLVMWLFYNHRGSLQSSLQASMQYIYVDSEQWRNLWTLLVHNQ
jgi:peroxisomal membrane protein 4